MSAQPSLLSKAEPGQVILPSNTAQVQVVRDRSAFGLGKYWAYFIDGTRELIGGPGGSQVGIQFEFNGTPLGTSGTVNELNFTGLGVTATRVGDKVTVDIPATPPPSAISIEGGQFSFNTSQGTVVVPTIKMLKIGFFKALINSGGEYNSWGDDSLVKANCNFAGPVVVVGGVVFRDSGNSIHIGQSNGGGTICTAKITAINPSDFVMTITPTVPGQVVTVDWHGIME